MNLLFVTISLSFSSKLKLFWAIISHHSKLFEVINNKRWTHSNWNFREENEHFHPEPQALIIIYINICARNTVVSVRISLHKIISRIAMDMSVILVGCISTLYSILFYYIILIEFCQYFSLIESQSYVIESKSFMWAIDALENFALTRI